MQSPGPIMKVWFISFLMFSNILLIKNCYSQNEWGWGWNSHENKKNYFENEILKNNRTLFSKLIWYYKKNVSPKQGPRCPCFPSCSTFTLYSMKKYGFFWGLIMGIERIYFRENLDITYRIRYLTLEVNGKEKVYDPPEANFIFHKKDWRIIDPFYFNVFFKQ